MLQALRNTAILIILCLASVEVSVRLAGISPIPSPSPGAVDIRIYMQDPQLGWINRPGVKQTLLVPGAPPHTVTILENGARVTGSRTSTRDVRRDLIFVGCSFTHGWGLNDEETFAWKVQAALPDWNVHNFGVGGFGTCQAYMLLKRLFEGEKWHKPLVIYGFIDDHEERNIAHFFWHYVLSVLSSTRNVSLPSCMLDSTGSIVFNAPRPYPQLPFRHTLAVISIFEKLYLKVEGASLARQSQVISQRLLVEIEEFTAAQSATFGVLFFKRGRARESHYRQFLEKRRSRIIEVDVADQKNTGTLTFFDGHPNSRMTDLIAPSVVRFVRSLDK